MEASSAINTPHPDAETDDAEDFFDGGSAAEEPQQAATGDVSAPETPEEPQAGTGQALPAAGAVEPQAGSDAAAQRGAVEREYIVFQKVPLTKEYVRTLLAEIEAGSAGQIRSAFFELHRPIARNDKQAVADTYKHHHATLGDECDVAAVSARSFKERHIEPEEVPAERKLRIT